MDGYKTVAKISQSEFCEKKSVFISDIAPVSTPEEAEAFIESVKKRTPDANHHVWAFINRECNIVRFSDDGEPKGTAGMPVLEVLKKEELSGVVAVVTRYFGGILLGAGGLTRAYARGARDAVLSSGITVFVKNDVFGLRLPYPKLSIVEREITKRKIRVIKKEFGEDIYFELMALPEERFEFDEFLSEMSSGNIKTAFIKNEFADTIK